MVIHLLPGLGTDRRLFSRLDLKGLPVKYLEWPDYGPEWSLADMAEALRKEVDSDQPHVLAGVSMGGMVAQELAALTRPHKVVLISSWTGPHEWPWTVKLGAGIQAHRVNTDLTLRGTWPVKQWLVGQGDPVVDDLLFHMACSQGAARIRHGLGAIFRWKGSPWKGPLVRIHGEADRAVPLRFPVDHRIRGGGHSMIIHQPREVAQALRLALRYEVPAS